MMLSLDTAYRSFGGEVEASSTPTICRLSDSRRHQISAIAPYGRDIGDEGIQPPAPSLEICPSSKQAARDCRWGVRLGGLMSILGRGLGRFRHLCSLGLRLS